MRIDPTEPGWPSELGVADDMKVGEALAVFRSRGLAGRGAFELDISLPLAHHGLEFLLFRSGLRKYCRGNEDESNEDQEPDSCRHSKTSCIACYRV